MISPSKAFVDDLIGHSEFYCRCVIEDAGFTWHVSHRDDILYVCTRDVNPERITLKIKGGKIIEATVG